MQGHDLVDVPVIVSSGLNVKRPLVIDLASTSNDRFPALFDLADVQGDGLVDVPVLAHSSVLHCPDESTLPFVFPAELDSALFATPLVYANSVLTSSSSPSQGPIIKRLRMVGPASSGVDHSSGVLGMHYTQEAGLVDVAIVVASGPLASGPEVSDPTLAGDAHSFGLLGLGCIQEGYLLHVPVVVSSGPIVTQRPMIGATSTSGDRSCGLLPVRYTQEHGLVDVPIVVGSGPIVRRPRMVDPTSASSDHSSELSGVLCTQEDDLADVPIVVASSPIARGTRACGPALVVAAHSYDLLRLGNMQGDDLVRVPVLVASGAVRSRRRGESSSGPLHIVDLVPVAPHVLRAVPSCEYCRAKRFYREPPGFCCSSGQVKIALHSPPDDLWELFTGNTPMSKEFSRFCWSYNNMFSFTSLGVSSDKDLLWRNRGVYTFKAQGQIYHFLNPLIPSNGPPKYLQLYFFDTDNELTNRLNVSESFDLAIISRLLLIVAGNPYSQFFRSLADLPSLAECSITITTAPTRDQRVYNIPTASQVAAIWVEDPDASGTGCREILVRNKMDKPCRVQFFYGCYDSMQYPLLLPRGEPGWHQGIKRTGSGCVDDSVVAPSPDICAIGNVEEFLEAEEQVMTKKVCKRTAVSCREYYAFLLQVRIPDRSLILHGGRLFQQYVVDMYIKLESSRLSYFEHHQKRIRAELYSGILDSIAIGESRGFKIGTRIVLPATFIGGPRDMSRRYLDAMTLVRWFGKPDLFITMTCNPAWPEITQELLPGEEAQNRPDLVSRVFRAKFEELKNDLVKRQIFGPVAGYVYVVEFQKRGLPHVHWLLILKKGHKIRTPEQFDKYVSAELPDEKENPHLYRAVCRHMMHGPCGHLNPKNVCMRKTNSCKNHYPKEFCENTTQTVDSYPLYRRRDNNRRATIRKHVLDNRWVIPYNPYLLAKYDCHINVEVCSTLKAVKYIYKYIYKGHDRVSFNVSAKTSAGDVDEITTFRDARWVAPPEAIWRLYKFHMNEIFPNVVILQLHLKDQQPVVYADQDDLEAVLTRALCKKTTLTEYFTMNAVSSDARKLLYIQFPQHYVWNQQGKMWTLRKQGTAVGRIISVSPLEGERFFLKLLLNNVRGACSYDDLKMFNGVRCETFMEAATLHGLCKADDCYRVCLEESSHYQMPQSLRRLFATILVYCNPVGARLLWEEFASSLSDDYLRSNNNNQIQAFNQVLRDIAHQVDSMGKDINDYNLTDARIVIDEHERGMKEMNDELSIVVPQCDIDNVQILNFEQRRAYNVIMKQLMSKKPGAFFIDGPGGTGKTFLYTVLLGSVRSQGSIALACASSGVAASVLPGGRTAHSRFKIPITTDEYLVCRVKKQSGLAKLLRAAKLIVWDEAPMVRRQTIEAFERMLRDICDCQLPYGGKIVVFGGDFRQILPVIPRGSMDSTIRASLVKSPLWNGLHKLRLIDNMRARLDPSFSDFILKVGAGRIEHIRHDEICLPASLVVPYTGPESLDVLINATFPNLDSYSSSLQSVINRAILSTRNDYVQEINDIVIERFPGDYYEYKSWDSAVEQTNHGLQEDYFNGLTPAGFPPHLLKLKKHCPVILLRNIDPSQGLCNGTRLICLSFGRNTIGAVIATGNHRGRHVFLPRIPLTPNENELGVYPFVRTQFPIRLCFCLTINKAQGQTLDFVGVYLPQSVFSHGQLYVALSRARQAASVAVLVVPFDGQCGPGVITRNVVYTEVLELASRN